MKVRRNIVIRFSAMALLIGSSLSADASGVLRPALDRPDRVDPVFISLGPTLGGSPDWGSGTIGFNASILFRPSRAAEFSPTLYHWNTGLLLDMEWRPLAQGRDAKTADVVFRKYLVDQGRIDHGAVLFAGFGGGRSLVSYPAAVVAESEDGSTPAAPTWIKAEQRWWSAIMEIGYEAEPAHHVIVTIKGRWRSYIQRPLDYSSWTLHVLVGIPIPW